MLDELGDLSGLFIQQLILEMTFEMLASGFLDRTAFIDDRSLVRAALMRCPMIHLGRQMQNLWSISAGFPFLRLGVRIHRFSSACS